MTGRQILLSFAICGCMGISTTNAYVESGSISEMQLKMVYPLVYTDNASSQQSINSDIANIVYNMKQTYDAGKYYAAGMSYEVTYEDENVISILLHSGADIYIGAAHGMIWDTGLVYDKNTGNRIPRAYYVNIAAPDQIQYGLIGHILTAYSRDMKPNHFYEQAGWEVKSISDNYILGGNGIVYLIYQPYIIGPFGAGPIKVEFTPKAIDYFSRCNS